MKNYTYKDGVLFNKNGRALGYDNGLGYLKVHTYKKKYFIHVLIWEMFNPPKKDGEFIDHIDGNKKNNKIENLRIVDRSGNSQNTRRPRINSSTGYLGVSKEKNSKKYRATIGKNGKKIHIGTFDNPIDAHKAYVSHKRKIHNTCTI